MVKSQLEHNSSAVWQITIIQSCLKKRGLTCPVEPKDSFKACRSSVSWFHRTGDTIEKALTLVDRRWTVCGTGTFNKFLVDDWRR